MLKTKFWIVACSQVLVLTCMYLTKHNCTPPAKNAMEWGHLEHYHHKVFTLRIVKAPHSLHALTKL